jgi:uncharacterized protein (TIGR02118 family)
LIIFWKNTPTDVEAFERHYREVHIPLAKKMGGLRHVANLAELSPDPRSEIYELEDV